MNIDELVIADQKLMGVLQIGTLLSKLSDCTRTKNVEFVVTETNRKLYLDVHNYDAGHFSYRGHYKDLALKMSPLGTNTTVDDVISVLEVALDEGELIGYKGGEFPITHETFVYVETDASLCTGMFTKNVIEYEDYVKIELGIED